MTTFALIDGSAELPARARVARARARVARVARARPSITVKGSRARARAVARAHGEFRTVHNEGVVMMAWKITRALSGGRLAFSSAGGCCCMLSSAGQCGIPSCARGRRGARTRARSWEFCIVH